MSVRPESIKNLGKMSLPSLGLSARSIPLLHSHVQAEGLTNPVSKYDDPTLIVTLGDRSVDTDTFARVHSNAQTVHPL